MTPIETLASELHCTRQHAAIIAKRYCGLMTMKDRQKTFRTKGVFETFVGSKKTIRDIVRWHMSRK